MEIRKGNVILNIDDTEANTPEAKKFYNLVVQLATFGTMFKHYAVGSKHIVALLSALTVYALNHKEGGEKKDLGNKWTTNTEE